MQIRNVTFQQLQKALNLVNEQYDYNIKFRYVKGQERLDKGAISLELPLKLNHQKPPAIG